MAGDFYWVAAHDFFLGSTISPGHWGRVLSSYLVGTPVAASALNQATASRAVQRLPTALREYIFESVRLRLNPQLPSRLEALFLFADLEHAQRLIVSQRPARNHEFVYRVELVEDRPAVAASMDITQVHPGDTVAIVAQKAQLYWTGYESDTMEWLTLSPIRVLDKVPLIRPAATPPSRSDPGAVPAELAPAQGATGRSPGLAGGSTGGTGRRPRAPHQAVPPG
ncbi:MAG: DUF2441 domain-containing protein [Pseudomonadota bacterium]